MPTPPPKPIIFISYAHSDEPEKPAEGEIKWLSFVTGYLKPAEKEGAAEIWTDRLMPGGADWDPGIERKLRGCDIFLLLVSPNSMASKYIVDKEIKIIRERQANGEGVYFYPLLLTPTPDIGLKPVRDKNLRPRDAKPFSSYSLADRYQHMSDAADEIVKIAGEIAARNATPASMPASQRPAPALAALSPVSALVSPARVLAPLSMTSTQVSPAPEPLATQSAPTRRSDSEPHAADLEIQEIKGRESREAWLKGQDRQVATAVAGRAALRVAPLAVAVAVGFWHVVPPSNSAEERDRREFEIGRTLSNVMSAVFRANALAWIAASYPSHAQHLRAAAYDAAALARTAVPDSRGVQRLLQRAFADPNASRDENRVRKFLDEASIASAAANAGSDAANTLFAAAYPTTAAAASDEAVRAGSGYASGADFDVDLTAEFMWEEIRSDIRAIQALGASAILDLSLWSSGAPTEWAREAWTELLRYLPEAEMWGVWTEWYTRRLVGGSQGEAYEYVFVDVPLDVRTDGSAAANNWIREHLAAT
jgi:hypothetical protein